MTLTVVLRTQKNRSAYVNHHVLCLLSAWNARENALNTSLISIGNTRYLNYFSILKMKRWPISR